MRDRLAVVLAAADRYRAMGFNPLPSRHDVKRPAMYYRSLWSRPLAPEHFDRVARRHFDEFGAINVQVMTGVRWGLAVVDLDGLLSRAIWRQVARRHGCPPTWAVARGDDSHRGRHLWFRVPPGLADLPTRVIYGVPRRGRPGFVERTTVELKGDRGLIVAPPSLHPATGQPYEWLPGCSPDELPLAELPAWAVDAAAASPRPSAGLNLRPPPRPLPSPARSAPWHRDWRDVMAAIPDPLAVACGWGLRMAGRPNRDGWASCHSPFRPDRVPSAGFNVRSGCYCEPGAGLKLTFFELGAAIGPYASWAECCDALGEEFGVPPRRRPAA